MKKRYIFLILLILIFSISTVSAAIFEFAEDNNQVNDADSNINSNDKNNDIKLIKEITSYEDGTTPEGVNYYEYWLKGELKNLPDDLKDYTLRGLFYSDGYIIGHQDDDFVDMEEESNDDSTNKDPYHFSFFIDRYEYVKVDYCEVILFDPNGDIILNETVDFNMK